MSDHIPEYIIMTRLLCRSQGATIYEMADALEKDVKTARNRLRELTFTFPLYSEPDPDNGKILRYKIPSYSKVQLMLPDMSFSTEEKSVFKMLSGNADMTPSLEVPMRRLINKLTLMASERGSMIKTGANEPVPIINAQTVVPKSVDNKVLHRKINNLLKTVSDKAWLNVKYHRIGRNEFTMQFYPVMVFISHRNPYVFGFNAKEEIRMLAIDRISALVPSDLDSHPSCDLKLLQELLSDPFGISCETQPYTVRLFIDSYQAPYEKEKQWPKGRVSFKDTEGGTIMTATTRTTFDVQRYILKRTPYIKVLEPEWLKEEVIKKMQSGIILYTK